MRNSSERKMHKDKGKKSEKRKKKKEKGREIVIKHKGRHVKKRVRRNTVHLR